jgi:ubiquinone/menaquinone biosynthesis C-methylase UbiE
MSQTYAPTQPKVTGLRTLLASKEIHRRDPEDYRQLVKDHYSGPAGWFTLLTGWLTGHESLAEDLFAPVQFDVRGCRRVLDAGCGNGRYLRFLLKRCDHDATLVGCDLCGKMLERARDRLKSDRPHLLSADITRLPYADATFDAAVCGWVLEHLPDLRQGLGELARVLQPNGKLLVLTTEHTLMGAICSRFYHAKTLRRSDLRAAAEGVGLSWRREFWWSKFHKLFRMGGIVVELGKRRHEVSG